MQLDFNQIMEQEKRNAERSLPWFLQTESAPLVKYVGESRTTLPNGQLGFICGSGIKEDGKNLILRTRSTTQRVSLLDLKPVKVTDFTESELHANYPKRFDYVEIVDNHNLRVVDAGYLTGFAPSYIRIKDKEESGKFINEREFDAKVHHFKGYRPEKLLIWRS